MRCPVPPLQMGRLFVLLVAMWPATLLCGQIYLCPATPSHLIAMLPSVVFSAILRVAICCQLFVSGHPGGCGGRHRCHFGHRGLPWTQQRRLPSADRGSLPSWSREGILFGQKIPSMSKGVQSDGFDLHTHPSAGISDICNFRSINGGK